MESIKTDKSICKFLQGHAKAQFESHCKYLMDTTLNAWTKNILLSNKYPLVVPNEDDPLLIFFEDRVTETLRFTILNSLIMCRLKIRGVLYTVPSALDKLKDLLSDLKDWVDIVPIEDKDIETFAGENYNNLLKRKSFWENIPAKKVLIVQTDALLIEPIDFEIFNYAYIGAPWSPSKYLSIPIYRYSKDLMSEDGTHWLTYKFNLNDAKISSGEIPFGNGGLTIRDTTKMIEICNLEPSTNNEPEDVYFARLLGSTKGNLPSLREARRFACETEYSESIGSHASHLYLKQEEQAKIYSRHISHLAGIIMASGT